ncbi:hypothetical protein P368_11770 [Comamonas thiooxydans]|nr:hypothetical protein P369_10505 [Comamonas thiooxydans]KGG98412.1 hypothetical protein P367_12770 [Comamonas thiooxydans]KGH04189.1 hypothetical protein P365_13945 [Comamonas thiooxydans]KGH12493.1 hypothetical protein P368_11770 [Comamonas thiooxydans]
MLQLVRDQMRGRGILAAFPPLKAQQQPPQLQWHH